MTVDLSRTSAYDYPLPSDLVARYPTERRDESRLLVVPRGGASAGPLRHLRFPDVLGLLRPGDVLVVNESRVLPARLVGKKPTGAPAEVLLLQPAASPGAPADPYRWEALVRPGGKLKPGRTILVAEDLEVRILDSTGDGGRVVRLETPLSLEEALERHGRVPLPPYLEREEEPIDRERYQTVYARAAGSVAAPTAGLHFTPELLERIEDRSVEVARLVLHVGVGTFRPVEEEDPRRHVMHRERYEIPPETARCVTRARRDGGRVWAVGTTVVRTLEAAADSEGQVRAGQGETDLFIHPPHTFRAVDGLLTNFHLPRSTLLMLVAAFAGYDRTMAAYREAVRERYRFYSYGDAMVVPPAG